MGKKNEIIQVLPAKKKSKGKKVVKVILAIAAINGALKLYSMYRENKDNEEGKNEGNEVKVYKVFMNGRQIKLDGEKVEGIFIKACMGGIDLDLRNAIITDDVFITCKNVMSGLDIRVPDGINVILDGKCILGGIDNSVPEAIEKEGPTIYIDYNNVMSGISVRPASKVTGCCNHAHETEDEDIFEDEFKEYVFNTGEETETKIEEEIVIEQEIEQEVKHAKE